MTDSVLPLGPRIWTPELWIPGKGWVPKVDLKRPWRTRIRAKEDAVVELAIDSSMPSGATFFDAGTTGLTSPRTFSFTNTAGNLLILCVGVSTASAGTVTWGAMTYNGVAMTQVVEKNTNFAVNTTGGRAAIYRLINPATGSNTVSMSATIGGTSGGDNHWNAICISYSAADTTTPIVQSISDAFGSSPNATATLTGVASGNATVSSFGCGTHITPGTALQPISAQLAVADDTSSLGNLYAEVSTATGSVSHGGTLAANDSWVVCIAEIKAGAAVAGGRPKQTRVGFAAVQGVTRR